MSKKFKFFILIFGLLSLSLVANFAFAQDFGTNAVANGLNNSLSSADPRFIIGRIIQVALSLLGVIAVVLVMYAGFLWMTSGGDEEKIGQAKKILTNAVIGLVIILMSWAITTFILSKLLEAMGSSTGNGGTSSGFISSGAGAIGACSVDSVYPTPAQKDVPRNTSIIITFKEEVKLDSVCVDSQGSACTCNQTNCNKLNPQAINIYRSELGNACSGGTCSNPNTNNTDVQVTVASGNKTLVLTPLSFLGSPTTNTPYLVRFTNKVKKLDNSSMFKSCSADYFEWGFEVNTSLDLTPPRVLANGIFPMPDNEKDIYRQMTPAVAASGIITVKGCPKVYSPATVTNISPLGPDVTLTYQGAISKFKVVVTTNENKAQLFDGSNNSLLGAADFDNNGQAVFNNFLIFKVASHPAGSSWEITISPEQLADTLTVGSEIYTFATNQANNNILVNTSNCSLNQQATYIYTKLSGDPNVNVDKNNNIVTLTAKVAGESGNSLALSSSNDVDLMLKAFSGGSNLLETSQPKDKRDRPMNSVIQINFNETVNPITVSGTATELANYIRVVNYSTSSKPAGTVCSDNADCRSYKCENNVCVGDYLGGKFIVSNAYRTVEFISDKECGMNGCGEKIYCLPANSHLAVEMMAANLKQCTSDNDCLAFSPFKSCAPTPLGYNTCQDLASKNYPTANLSSLDGVVDAAINSFDGDRSTYSDGPIDFYNDNLALNQNQDKKDKYRWSFYINDKIASDPPQISFINPVQGENNVDLLAPLQINFSTLMMNSTLRTGSVLINNGTSTFEHKLVNLRSANPTPLGYWVLSNNEDSVPLDGEPDLTTSYLNHSPLIESVAYKAQIGSGVKDIYQNCFKPSAGPSCTATPSKPSCCFGTITDILGADGNCQQSKI